MKMYYKICAILGAILAYTVYTKQINRTKILELWSIQVDISFNY